MPTSPSIHDAQPAETAKASTPSLLRHLTDVHAHPTDSETPASTMAALHMTICAMATRAHDQQLVAQLADAYPDVVIPCFGWHPWFAHHISRVRGVGKEAHYRALLLGERPNEAQLVALERVLPSLPEPTHVDAFLTELRINLSRFPHAMLGEVGIDKLVRIPYGDNPTDGRKFSPLQVPLEHQILLLEAQVAVAVEMQRNISIHSVKVPQATVDLLEKMAQVHGVRWTQINLDLHSCTMSKDVLQRIMSAHRNVYMSLSSIINVTGRSDNYVALVQACPDDRILVESDYDNVSMCEPQTWDIACRIAEIKGWEVETEWRDDKVGGQRGAVHRLQDNWIAFSRKQA